MMRTASSGPKPWRPSQSFLSLGMDKSETVAEATEALYADLKARGVNVAMDDRKERPV